SVCEMVYEGIQNNQTTKVEVNGTSAEDASACNKEEDNTIGFFFITNAGEGGTTPEDLCESINCVEGYECKAGICIRNVGPEYISGEIVCKKDLDCGTDGCQHCSERCYPVADGTACAEGQGVCHQGSCVKNGCENGCANDEYCGDTNEDPCSPTLYKCKKLNFSKIEITQGIVYLSNQNMTYWDAESACNALGAKLIDQAKMNELYDEIKSKIFGLQEAWWLSETQNCQAYYGATYFQLQSKNSNDYVSALCFDAINE
ncbi:MAG: hypothetical protein IKV03_06200, partial [Alphaproteobacteria bacterium]|nr:hypothetical protein [Alphaproteobacteria bacterium]